MGGNVKLNGFKAEPWNCDNTHRYPLVQIIRFFLSDLSEKFKETYGYKIPPIAFGGSTRILMDTSILNEEFCQFKKTIADVDILIDKAVKNDLIKLLKPGFRLGIFTLIGTKLHGHEVSALFRHNFHGHVSQWDFAFVDKPWELDSQFLHWSDWEDLKLGIKGVHHKLILNAVGLDKFKFSITHGLRCRTDETDTGNKSVHDINFILFGSRDIKNIWSFRKIIENITSFDRSEQENILDKYKESCSKIKNIDHSNSITYFAERIK